MFTGFCFVYLILMICGANQDGETGTVYSGAMLMNAGLNLTRDVYEDGTSVTKHFKAVK